MFPEVDNRQQNARPCSDAPFSFTLAADFNALICNYVGKHPPPLSSGLITISRLQAYFLCLFPCCSTHSIALTVKILLFYVLDLNLLFYTEYIPPHISPWPEPVE